MSEQAESEGRREAQMELGLKLVGPMQHALTSDLQSEAALIALLINAILTNTTVDLLMKLRTTKPGA